VSQRFLLRHHSAQERGPRRRGATARDPLALPCATEHRIDRRSAVRTRSLNQGGRAPGAVTGLDEGGAAAPMRYRTAVRVPGPPATRAVALIVGRHALEARRARARRHAGQGHRQATEAHAGLLAKCRSVGVVGQLSVCAVLRRVAPRAAILPIWAARAWSSGATLLLSALAEGGQRRRGRIGHLLGDKLDGPAQSRWGRRRCRVRRVVGDSAEPPSPQAPA
jgi:hypothetical protein